MRSQVRLRQGRLLAPVGGELWVTQRSGDLRVGQLARANAGQQSFEVAHGAFPVATQLTVRVWPDANGPELLDTSTLQPEPVTVEATTA